MQRAAAAHGVRAWAGRREKARELAQKLDPNFVSEAELRATWGSGGGPAKKARKPQKS